MKKVVDRHTQGLEEAKVKDLLAVIEFCQRENEKSAAQAVLHELLQRDLDRKQASAALMAATLLADADMMRSFTRKLNNQPQNRNDATAAEEKNDIIVLEELGVSGYRADSDEAVLIFNSLEPSQLRGVVDILLEKNISPLFVHDSQRLLHLAGLGNKAGSIESSSETLKAALAEQGITKLHTIGFSGGGLGALLYADALSASSCLVFSPPTFAPTCDDKSEARAQILRRKVEKLNLRDVADVAKRYSGSKNPPKTHVYYPADSQLDILHAERLSQLESIEMFPQETKEHSFFRKWGMERWREAIEALLANPR